MENNIKKTIDDIEVPLDKLDQAIQNGLQCKTKKRKNPFVVAAISVVATVALILGSGFISPQMAKVLADVPLIGFMYKIEEHDKGLYTALSDENKVTLNETVTSNGIAITVEEIVYDGARLNIIFSMPSYRDVYPLTILVNGEVINTGESLRTLEDNDVYRGLWEIKIPDNLPDAFDLTIKMHEINGTKGEWVFNTPIKKVNNNSHSLVAGQSGEIGDISFTVESVESSTTTTKVKVKFDTTMQELFSEKGVLHTTITDQHGTPMNVLDRSGSGDEKGTIYTYLIEPLSEGITELNIIYYFFPFYHERDDIIEPLAETFPQRISQGKMGDIVITGVEKSGPEATLTFNVDSDFPYDEYFTPNFIAIEDASGENLETDFIKSIGPNEYQLTFQTNAGKPYVHTVIAPFMKVEPSATVTIPVK
ncbi:DUF4179 domain-containing protein [Solibacillus sp. CAU 1738]|uniref:DUF4179 domain-containing protein n=1 Tax=Solibacillus sp. CAU 1738 TaxID=3140363 RepID=UPI0032602D5E